MQRELDVFKPYLIRAVYDWCLDNANAPHIVARAGDSGVPPEMVGENGIVVLNVSLVAVRDFKAGPRSLAFTARFGGRIHEVEIPYEDVLVIYGRESGHRLSFLSGKAVGPEHFPAEETGSDSDPQKRKLGRKNPDLRAY